MNIPHTEQHPDDPNHLPPARRRRARRLLAPLNADEKADFLLKVAHLLSPNFDFYLFSLLSGLILGFGLLTNEPAILIMGVLLAPFMSPIIGISLGTVIGSPTYFLHNVIGFLIGSLMVFLSSALAGYVSLYWSPSEFTAAHYLAQLSWANFLLLAVGTIVTAAGVIHFVRTANVSSIALAYTLYIPIAVAGFGLTSGVPNLWPDGLVVFSVYLAWSALLGAVTLAFLGFRPLTLFGYTLSGVILLLGIIVLIGVSSAGVVIGAQVGIPTPIPSATPTFTATFTVTPTPIPPTSTPTPTATPIPPTATSTPTKTPTPTATPMFAYVDAGESGGAFVRDEPAGEIIGLVANGDIVQVLPESDEVDGKIWLHIITPAGYDGWMLETLLVRTTPTPPSN